MWFIHHSVVDRYSYVYEVLQIAVDFTLFHDFGNSTCCFFNWFKVHWQGLYICISEGHCMRIILWLCFSVLNIKDLWQKQRQFSPCWPWQCCTWTPYFLLLFALYNHYSCTCGYVRKIHEREMKKVMIERHTFGNKFLRGWGTRASQNWQFHL